MGLCHIQQSNPFFSKLLCLLNVFRTQTHQIVLLSISVSAGNVRAPVFVLLSFQFCIPWRSRLTARTQGPRAQAFWPTHMKGYLAPHAHFCGKIGISIRLR
jgi:hypothetical protein